MSDRLIYVLIGALIWCANVQAQRNDPPDPDRFRVLMGELSSMGRGDVERTLPLIEEALAIAARTFGGRDARTLDLLSFYGTTLVVIGRHDSAVVPFRLAAKGYADAFGVSNPETLSIRFALARALIDSVGGQDEGLKELRAVYIDSRKYLGASDADTITRGLFLSSNLGAHGFSEEQERTSAEVFSAARSSSLSDEDLRRVYKFRAWALQAAGKVDEAVAVIDEALVSPRRTAAEESQEARAELLATKCSLAIRPVAKKREVCDLALRQEMSLPRPRALPLLVIKQDFAIAHLEGGAPSLAASVLEHELASLPSGKEFEVQRPVLEQILADSYREMGRLPEALSLAEAAMRRFLTAYGPISQRTLKAASTVAAILRELRMDSEHRFFVRAQQFNIQKGSPRNVLSLQYEVAEMLSLEGDHKGALDTAVTVYERAVALYGSSEHPMVRDHSRLVVALSLKVPEPHALDVLALARVVHAADVNEFGPSHPRSIQSGVVLSHTMFSAKRVPEYLKNVGASLDRIEEWRDAAPLLSDERLRMWESFSHQFATVAQLPDPSGGNLSDWHSFLFIVGERSKTSARFESLALERFARGPLRGQLRELASEAAQLKTEVLNASSTTEKVRLYSVRGEVERRYAEVAAAVLKEMPAAERLAIRGRVNPKQFVSSIANDEVFLSYSFPGGGYGVAFVVDKSGVRRFRIEGGAKLSKSIDAAIAFVAALPQLRKKLWKAQDGSYRYGDIRAAGEVAASGDELWTYLGQTLAGDLGASLGGKRKLIVSPDGVLWQIPFEVLRFGNRSLVEQVDVGYAPSAAMFQLSRERARKKGEGWQVDLLAIGAPNFSLAQSEAAVIPGGTSTGRAASAAKGQLGERLKNERHQWESLPGTRKEIDRVAKEFPPSRVVILTEEAASEARIRDLSKVGALRRTKYVLFATHGYVAGKDPNFNALILAGANDATNADGYLTAAEIVGLDLGSQLVVLSACETGRGQYRQGEGIASLATAVMLAGATASLATLWPVEDEATADFMTSFFRRLNKEGDAARALAATKQEFLRDPKRAEPMFWAPFVLIGG